MELTYTVFRQPVSFFKDKSHLVNLIRRSSMSNYSKRESVSLDQFLSDSLSFVISPAIFKDYSSLAKRNDENVLSYPSFIGFDFDTPFFGHRDFINTFPDLNCVIVSSFSHNVPKGDKPACERFHVYVFLKSSILSKESRNLTRDFFLKMLPAFLNDTDRGPAKPISVLDESLTFCGVFFPGKEVLYKKTDGVYFDPILDVYDLNKRLSFDTSSPPNRDSEFVDLLKSKGFWSESIGYVANSVLSLILDGIPPGTRWDNISLCVFALYNAGLSPSQCKDILLDTLRKNAGDTSDNLSKLDRMIKRVSGMKRLEKYYRPRNLGVSHVDVRGEAVFDESVISLERDHIIDELCSRYLRFHRDESRTVLYSLKEDDQLTFCQNQDFAEASIVRDLSKTKLPVLRKKNGVNFISYEFWPPKKVLERWVISAAGLESEPAEFRFKSDPGYCIRRLPFDLSEGKYPAWEEGLCRMSSPETFMSFVGSVLDLKNRSRQALWLWGPRGQDGKSVMIRVLGSVFGDAHATMNTDVSTQFMYAPLFKKRLITLPDLKDTGFVKTSQFRKIVSGDPVSIERKGENAFTAILNVKLIICSNYPPTITSGNADLSRLILIKIQQSKNRDDETWEQRLTDELPFFLNDCVKIYRQQVPEGKSMIPLPESSVHMLISAAKSSEIEFRSAFNAIFNLDSKSSLTEDEVFESLCLKRHNDSFLIKKSDFRKFLTFLNTEHGIDLEFCPKKSCNVLNGISFKEGVFSESSIPIT